MNLSRSSALVSGGLLLAAAFLPGCGGKHDPAGPAGATVVKVSPPVERNITDYEYVTGRTEAVKTVDIRARVTGYLEVVDFKAGDTVDEGKVLFKIDPRPYQAELDRASGQVLLQEASLKLAVADYARARKTASDNPNAISRQELDTSAAKESQTDASVKAAKANAESARLNLGYTTIASPITGVIGRNLIDVGNLVTQDQTSLATIVSEDPMYAYFNVDERTMLRIQKLIREGKMKSAKAGAHIEVGLGLANEEGQYPHQGAIDFVNNRVSSSTGTLQVRGQFDNPKPPQGVRVLTPGLFVRVRVPIGSPHPALLVPQSALGTDQGAKFLFVVNDQNVVEYRPVAVGAIQSDGMQVVEPLSVVRTKDGVRLALPEEKGEPSLKKSDKVVVSGLQRVRPGLTVTAKPAEAK